MKIAIDVSPVIYGTGVSVYTDNLVKNLLLIDRKNEYIPFGGSLRRMNDLKRLDYVKKVFPIPPTLADIIWNRLHTVPIEWLIGSVDVFHSSDWTQPPSKAFKVTTIHDLSPLKFPKFTHPKIKSSHEARLAWVAKEIDRIIVPSQATKRDLVDLGFGEKIIRVIPEAPREDFKKHSNEEIASLKRKYRINGKYLITVGIGGRKNTENLIKAFELAKAGENLTLVLVGETRNHINESRGLRYVGHLPNNELSILYSGAEALLYTSLYEGFGLPILEAMKCGCPVVTSNVSSMPETAGGGALLVDPYHVDSITQGIKEALKNKNELIKKGHIRVKDFSWTKTAEETLKVYKEAIPSQI